MVKVANRMMEHQQSPLRAMTVRCQEVGAINLAQGLSQVPPPASLLVEGERDFGRLGHSYSPPEGLATFREAVADKLKRCSGLNVEPATQVVATVGATGALVATLTALYSGGECVDSNEKEPAVCVRFFQAHSSRTCYRTSSDPSPQRGNLPAANGRP